MEFRTIVELPERSVTLSPHSSVVLLGSCFAQNIGERMQEEMPDGSVCVNPFGVLYNPESIRTALEIMLFGSLFFPDEYIFQGRDGLWHSWLHSGAFSSPERSSCVETIKKSYDTATASLRTANVLCVTFGTNRVYEHKQRGFVVGNCHKELPATFAERQLGVEEIIASWDIILDELEKELPEVKVVFTVSPYRYAKYGFHDSQLAKATLLLAVENLCQKHSNVCYFPAYEIVLDELRDYRFFSPDMLHPSPQASDYVWKRFSEWSFSEELRLYSRERIALMKMEAHKTLFPDSEEDKSFQQKLEKKRIAFQKKWGLKR